MTNVPQGRERAVPEGDVWSRWRCDCGAVFVVTKTEARAKIAELKGRGDYFTIPCICGIHHVFKRK